jgi:hypothetical protein
MESRDWELCVVDRKNSSHIRYYVQHKSAYQHDCEEILHRDLTKAEAIALLSLLGAPVKSIDDYYYYVYIEK